MSAFERFILGLPSATLKKPSYLWFVVVLFYSWPPVISGIAFLILLSAEIILRAQAWIWEKQIRRDCEIRKATFYVDRPHTPFRIWGRNLALVLIFSVGVSWFLNQRIAGVSGIQWFLLAIGFVWLQKEWKIFDAPTSYYITDDGLWIRHINLKLFFKYAEISKVLYIPNARDAGIKWDTLTPTDELKEGLLLIPKNEDGFTRLLKKIFITPHDMNGFVKHLPEGMVVKPQNLTGVTQGEVI